jgi:hypothetical protein
MGKSGRVLQAEWAVWATGAGKFGVAGRGSDVSECSDRSVRLATLQGSAWSLLRRPFQGCRSHPGHVGRGRGYLGPWGRLFLMISSQTAL